MPNRKETIKQVQHNFVQQGYQNNSTLEHSGKSIPNVTFVETWIKEDEVHDKSVLYGFSEPVGTLFGLMKVNNDEIWNDYVKTGKVKGFSIDGVFDMEKVNLKSEINLHRLKFKCIPKIYCSHFKKIHFLLTNF